MELKKVKRVEKSGKVISAKMEKTRVVLIVSRVKHPFYNKFIKKTRKIVVHDEANMTTEGDTVKVVQCRPLSKNKRWIIREVVEKGERNKNGASHVSSDGSR
ncbi:MAG TPA: 30S ribosomal protein S17 [bacterium]|nr:30S ribosomal protein S17 [bacterium]